MIGSLRWAAGRALDAHAHRPSHARFLWRQVYHVRRNDERELDDRDHLRAAVRWIGRAQDATADGGISGRYSLRRGWTSSYPETTGYLIPTLLALEETDLAPLVEGRAEAALRFLLDIQLPSGAFPGREIAENRTEPSVFNTGQIVHGLLQWYRREGGDEVLRAAGSAARWMASVQDPDGAWRDHVYENRPASYTAFASCHLADLGRYIEERDVVEAARMHVRWVLAQRDESTGWFRRSGFTREDHRTRRAPTHTIAYTLSGVLHASCVLDLEEGIDAVRRAAERALHRYEVEGRLPGVLNADWKSAADYVCLTGNAQMALVWMELYRLLGDPRFLNGALKAIDDVKRRQPLRNGNGGIRGGIPGSWPAWGDYLYMALPNWAAKFFVDALLDKSRLLEEGEMELAASYPCEAPGSLSVTVPDPEEGGADPSAVTVAVYAFPRSEKASRVVDELSARGCPPGLLVLEEFPSQPAWRRLLERIRQEGMGWIPRKVIRLSSTDGESSGTGPEPELLELCDRRGIETLRVGPLSDEESVARVRETSLDLAIYATRGILRPPILEVPSLGTLNAHMGLLPCYRGMNVAEWSQLAGDSVGCSVYLMDPGVDTGDVLARRVVDASSVDSVADLRRLVDEAQLDLLGEVVETVVRSGRLPGGRPQEPDEGVQFFRMHPILKDRLDARLTTSQHQR